MTQSCTQTAIARLWCMCGKWGVGGTTNMKIILHPLAVAGQDKGREELSEGHTRDLSKPGVLPNSAGAVLTSARGTTNRPGRRGCSPR